MPGIGVVHLIRRKNGIATFARFLETYRAHPAGVDHDLVLIFKGFGSEEDAREYRVLLSDVPHRRLYIPDSGYDLGAYFRVVRQFDYDYFCFFNSFSRILADNWLAHLYEAVTTPGVGIAGATGSFESFSENSRRREVFLGELDTRGRVRFMMQHIAEAQSLTLKMLRFFAWIARMVGIWKLPRYFPAFPNAHVRSNAFMASRDALARVRFGPLWLKFFNFQLESGHRSITNQIAATGLRPVIVGRTGRVYERDEWPHSATFRQSAQENLLVADNQTEAYTNADDDYRAELSRRAWGDLAKPS